MADVSELLIEVKNINKTLSDIQSVGDKLKQTQNQAVSFGKAMFAGWSFTKIIKAAKEFGDAWKDNLITFRNFDVVFGRFNSKANTGLKELVKNFAMTEKGARKLLATIGSRVDFGLNIEDQTNISTELAKISQEIAQFYGMEVDQVSQKLTNALSGMTKGLKEFGMSIDTSSPKFKELVNEIMISTGKTEEAAKAMAVYNEILKKSEKFKGTFDAQAKTLSQAFDNISNSLRDGPFAKAGEILSNIFVPILNKVNDLINIPWVKTLMGIVSALGLVLASVVAIQFAVNGLSASLTKMAVSGGAGGLAAGLLTKIGALIKGIFVGLIKYIAIGVGAVITFIAGLPAWAIAAIIAVLAAGVTLLINKLTTGEWFNFSGMVKAVVDWFKKAGKQIVKAFVGDDEELNKSIKRLQKENNEKAQEINKVYDDFFKEHDEWFKNTKPYKKPTRLEELKKEIDESEKKLNTLTKVINDAQGNWVKVWNNELVELQKQIGEHEHIGRLYQSGLKELAKKSPWRVFTILANDSILREHTKEYKKLKEKEQELLSKLKSTFDKDIMPVEAKAREIEEARLKALAEYQEELERVLEEERKVKLKIDQMKFGDFTWYQDAMRKIQDGLGKTLPQDKIKDLNKRIEEFKKTFTHMSPEEQKDAYKEISRMELEKFHLEMEIINKERDALQKTNELIQGYVERAMEWKPAGVEGIQANTMEGYKFLTSSLGSISNLGPILQQTQNQEAELQKKANDIAAGTKSSVDEIKKKIEKLGSTSQQLNITVVN